MARTIRGNLTGRAASIHHSDEFAQRIEDDASAIQARIVALGNALADLKMLDPRGWEVWYDNFVPDFHYVVAAEMDAAIKMVTERVAQLRNECDYPTAVSFYGGEVVEIYPEIYPADDGGEMIF